MGLGSLWRYPGMEGGEGWSHRESVGDSMGRKVDWTQASLGGYFGASRFEGCSGGAFPS